MANRKISELTAAGALTGTELVEVVQGGVNKQTTAQDIADLGGGGGGVVETIVAGTNITVDDTDPANPIISASGGGGGDWGDIGGTLSDQTDLQAALDAKQALVNSATALTDASSMALTAIKHTLTTSSATRTFTISYTGDDITLIVTLNTTATVFTFPATALCISEGFPSGDNTCSITAVSGDKIVIAIKKVGSDYYVVAKNFGQ